MTKFIEVSRSCLQPALLKFMQICLVCHLLSIGSRSATLLDSVTWMSSPKLKSLLSQPGGLQSAIGLVKNILIRSDTSTSAPLTLQSLSALSSAIIVGNVLRETVIVDPNTNIVQTAVHLQVDETLKGNTSRFVDILILGGRVIFGTNQVADVQTIESQSMPLRSEIVAFLSPTDQQMGSYVPTNGYEGLFHLHPSTGLVTSFTISDHAHKHLLDPAATTLTSFRTKLGLSATLTPVTQ